MNPNKIIKTLLFACISNSIKDKKDTYELLMSYPLPQLRECLQTLDDWQLQAIRSGFETLWGGDYRGEYSQFNCIVFAYARNEQNRRKNGKDWITRANYETTVSYNSDPVFNDPYNIYDL
jgi:hypothetical protein